MPFLRSSTSQITLLAAAGLGLLTLLIAQVLYRSTENTLWAAVILLPGLVFVWMGMRVGPAGRSLIIFGCVTITLGVVLAFQSLTGLWQTWLYMWLLLLPAVGIGKVLYGHAANDEPVGDEGWRMIGVGVVLFHVALFVCEVILGVSGMGLFNSPIITVLGPLAAFVLIGIVLLTEEPAA
jgi:hypothetical protein